MEKNEIEDLLVAVASGKLDAMKTLYDRASPPLFALLLRMLKSEAIAEEALQETFIKIWDKADSYQSSRSSPMTWMSRIARNQAIDVLRYHHVRTDLDTPDQSTLLTLLEAPPSNGAPEQLQQRELLLLCLQRLKEVQRFCVVKAYVDGYSHEELSQSTGSPVGTIKSWIHRSLRSLRSCLDEHD